MSTYSPSLYPAAQTLLDSLGVQIVAVRYVYKGYVYKEKAVMDPPIAYVAVFPTDASYYAYMKGVEEGEHLWQHIDSKFMFEVAGFRGETVADLTTLERNVSDFIVIDILE